MSTTWASNGSVADVQAKVNGAANGDIVTIPAGTFSWASGITCGKSITITSAAGHGASPGTGAGTLFTTINFTAPSTPAIQLNIVTSGGHARVSGIIFSGITGAGTNPFISVDGRSGTDSFRIDNCSFQGGNNLVIQVTYIGRAAGLVDHCTFICGGSSECIHNSGAVAGDNSGWLDNVTPGSVNFLYVENCQFTNLSTTVLGNLLQGYYGSRSCIRYCNISYGQIDQHGTAGQIGARWFEFYNNVFNIPSGQNLSNFYSIRGGSGFIYSNHITGGPNSGTAGIQFSSDDPGPNQAYGPGAGIFVAAAPNPAPASPVYLWDNGTGDSTAINGTPPMPVVSTTGNITTPNNYISSAGFPASIKIWQQTTGQVVGYSYTPLAYPHPLIAQLPDPIAPTPPPTSPPATPGGNNPFMPIKFPPGPPTAEKGVYEDGPGLHVNPANTGPPVYYNGQNQTSILLSANPKPPRQTTPSAADKAHSQIPKG